MGILALVVVVFEFLGIISAVNAVMTARTSQGAIAWAVSLLAFPYLAVPAYWFLGRSKFRGYVTARRSTHESIEQQFRGLLDGVEPFRVRDSDMTQAGKAAEKLADWPLLNGNNVELLIDGDATFDSICEGIDAAKKYILFQFFIVKDDALGRRIKDHLIAKAREGVAVYFLYDEIGSHELPDAYKDELRAAGAWVFDFHTQKGARNRFQINFRNHRKVVVVDGETAWIGGHNVGDEYMGKDPKFGHWRDTHIKIEGPSVFGTQLSFLEDWYWATETIPPDMNWTPKRSEVGNQRVLIIPSGPADELETCSLMFLHAINSAQKRIWIASPYFVPDDAIISALQLAGLRGVDVRVLIPDKPDHLLIYLAAFSYFEDAGRTGVRFYRYIDGFMHGKSGLIDDVASIVGTANFDNRSFRLNFEITALIADPEFAKEVEKMFEADFANSREMEKGELARKSFWFKLAVRFARLTSPMQ